MLMLQRIPIRSSEGRYWIRSRSKLSKIQIQPLLGTLRAEILASDTKNKKLIICLNIDYNIKKKNCFIYPRIIDKKIQLDLNLIQIEIEIIIQ